MCTFHFPWPDLTSERTAFWDKAYPEIQDFCQNLGFTFEVCACILTLKYQKAKQKIAGSLRSQEPLITDISVHCSEQCILPLENDISILGLLIKQKKKNLWCDATEHWFSCGPGVLLSCTM